MRIHENIAALNARRHLAHVELRQLRSTERLSTGLRINRAADDASGLVRSEQLRAQIVGLRAASHNTQTALSFVQTAEGGLIEVHAALQRMRELTVAAGNLGAGDELTRRALQAEIEQYAHEIDRIAADTSYGTVSLLDGSFAAPTPAVFQVGAQPRQRLEVAIDAADATSLGVDALDVGGGDPAEVADALGALDRAISATSTSRAALGAEHNRLRATVRSLENTRENLMAAESRIRDTDLALESIEQARNVVMLTTGTSMLAVAQRVPDAVLDLLGLPP